MPSNKMSELAGVLPPPAAPLDFDEAMIRRNQAVLRTEFPADFLEFAQVYGSGTIETAYSWEVWSPARATYPLIVLGFGRIWNIFKEAMEIDDAPFGIFPEVGGVLPFASTSGGEWVCWITQGEPDEWEVVDLWSYEKGFYQVLPMGFSEYFLNVLTRTVVLDRHRNGQTWEAADVRFRQAVYRDCGYFASS